MKFIFEFAEKNTFRFMTECSVSTHEPTSVSEDESEDQVFPEITSGLYFKNKFDFNFIAFRAFFIIKV